MTRTKIVSLALASSVLLLGLIIPRGAAAYSSTQTQNITQSGQNIVLTFSGLPSAVGNVTVQVTVEGDYNSTSEYAQIYIDNADQGQFQGPGQCAGSATTSYTVSSSAVTDGTLVVRAQNSGSVGTFCSPQYVTVTVSYLSNTTPVATSGLTITTAEDSAGTVTLSGSDADGDTLSYSANQPSNGSVSCAAA